MRRTRNWTDLPLYIEAMAAPVIFFEFDDVLAETRAPRLAALRQALAIERVEFSDEVFDSTCGGLSFAAAARAAVRVANITGRAADETSVELASLRAGRAFGQLIARGIPLAPGAAAIVRAAAGIARLGIVTRAPRRDVDLVLSFSGLADSFECVVTAEDYSGPEPSSDPYDIAVGRMARGTAVTIGDGIALVSSLNAVAAARAARLHPIVVGPVSPSLAFAGDGYLPTLDGASVRDLLRLAAGAGAR
jgi:beta-phosphoglucomutase-like phosphatase (HAD superfamily)